MTQDRAAGSVASRLELSWQVPMHGIFYKLIIPVMLILTRDLRLTKSFTMNACTNHDITFVYCSSEMKLYHSAV